MGVVAALVATLMVIVRVVAGPGEPIPRPSRRQVAACAVIFVLVGVRVGQALIDDPAVLPPCPSNAKSFTLVMEAYDGDKVRIDHDDALLPDGSTLACRYDPNRR